MGDAIDEENYDKEENMFNVSWKEGFEISVIIDLNGTMPWTKYIVIGYKYFEFLNAYACFKLFCANFVNQISPSPGNKY